MKVCYNYFIMKKILRKDVLTSVIIIAIAVVLAGGWVAISKTNFKFSNITNATVVTVNSSKIKQKEYDKLYQQLLASQGLNSASIDDEEAQELKDNTIDILISRELVRQAGVDLEISISDSKIEEEFERAKASFATEDDFRTALKTENLTETDLREIIEIQFISDAVIEKKIDSSQFKASEEEIRKMYDDVFYDDNSPEYSEVSEQIETLLNQQKLQEAVTVFIEELKEVAEIEILI